jgi:hypothetical protein
VERVASVVGGSWVGVGRAGRKTKGSRAKTRQNHHYTNSLLLQTSFLFTEVGNLDLTCEMK